MNKQHTNLCENNIFKAKIHPKGQLKYIIGPYEKKLLVLSREKLELELSNLKEREEGVSDDGIVGQTEI